MAGSKVKTPLSPSARRARAAKAALTRSLVSPSVKKARALAAAERRAAVPPEVKAARAAAAAATRKAASTAVKKARAEAAAATRRASKISKCHSICDETGGAGVKRPRSVSPSKKAAAASRIESTLRPWLNHLALTRLHFPNLGGKAQMAEASRTWQLMKLGQWTKY